MSRHDARAVGSRVRPGSEGGGVLLLALFTTLLVSGLGGALVMLLATEEAVEANHRGAVQARYAAEGLLAAVTADLADLPVWDGVLSGTRPSSFGPVAAAVRLADGSRVDLHRETVLAREGAAAADRAPWRLHGGGWVSDLLGRPEDRALLFAVAWVADDLADPDADPEVDGNQRIALRAAAFGPRGARQVVQAVLTRAGGRLSLTTWERSP